MFHKRKGEKKLKCHVQPQLVTCLFATGSFPCSDLQIIPKTFISFTNSEEHEIPESKTPLRLVMGHSQVLWSEACGPPTALYVWSPGTVQWAAPPQQQAFMNHEIASPAFWDPLLPPRQVLRAMGSAGCLYVSWVPELHHSQCSQWVLKNY